MFNISKDNILTSSRRGPSLPGLGVSGRSSVGGSPNVVVNDIMQIDNINPLKKTSEDGTSRNGVHSADNEVQSKVHDHIGTVEEAQKRGSKRTKVQWASVLNEENILTEGIKRTKRPTAKASSDSSLEKKPMQDRQSMGTTCSRSQLRRNQRNTATKKSSTGVPLVQPHSEVSHRALQQEDNSPLLLPDAPDLLDSYISGSTIRIEGDFPTTNTASGTPKTPSSYNLRPRATIRYNFSEHVNWEEDVIESGFIQHNISSDLSPSPLTSKSAPKKIVLKYTPDATEDTAAGPKSHRAHISNVPTSLPSPPSSLDTDLESPSNDSSVSQNVSKSDGTLESVIKQVSTPILSNQVLLAPHIVQEASGEWSHGRQISEGQSPKKRRLRETPERAAKRHAAARDKALSPIFISTTELLPISHVLQNSDGTWTILQGSLNESSIRATRKRKLSDLNYEPEQGSTEASPQVRSSLSKTTRRQAFNNQFRAVQDGKPLPHGEPPVWAEKRQALCETLPYYRAYQSGAYTHDGVALAFMVDKEVGDRDKLDEEILIARVGGGRKLNEETGQMVLNGDQNKSTFALAFMRSRDTKQPVAVIVGQGNRLSPSKMPHYYNILDWFHVTDVWCERSGQYKCWMVRLEKINLHVKSWWAPASSPLPDPNRDLNAFQTTSRYCAVCGHSSKQIYNLGWACLETACEAFFNFGKEVNDDILDYSNDFLNERNPFTGKYPLKPLVPPLITQSDLDSLNGTGTESICYTGIVCPMCRGCIRRRDWRQWTCETPGCPFIHTILQKPIKVSQAIAQGATTEVDFCNYDFGIRSRQTIMGSYDVFEYTIPGVDDGEVAGIVRLFKSSGVINKQPDGPNDLFMQMQERDFGLKRNPARQAGSTGEILTSHFATNWGAPYKYGVSVLSRGFDEAPPVIIKAVKRLTWAGQQTVSETLGQFAPFNELLSIGYFEATDIGYHDDGESTLGPTVASLSLGAQAVMSFRPKARSGLGPKSKNARGTKQDVLRITLDHGDLMVMHGTQIQKLYEHAVRPSGKLRFALTCRYVRPELMDNDEERKQAQVKGTLPIGHEQYDYNGHQHLGDSCVLEEANESSDGLNIIKSIIQSGELSSTQLQEVVDMIQNTNARQ